MLLGSGLIRYNHRSELGIHFSGADLGIALCAITDRPAREDARTFMEMGLGSILMLKVPRAQRKPDRRSSVLIKKADAISAELRTGGAF